MSIFNEIQNYYQTNSRMDLFRWENNFNTSVINSFVFKKEYLYNQPNIANDNDAVFDTTVTSNEFNEVKMIPGISIIDLLSDHVDIIQSISENNILFLTQGNFLHKINLTNYTLIETINLSNISRMSVNDVQYMVNDEINHNFHIIEDSIYPTTLKYSTTISNGQFDTSDVLELSGFSTQEHTPTNTTIKYLFSIDNKSSWLYWNSSNWVVGDISINGMLKSDIESLPEIAMTELTGLLTGTLDVMIGLETSDQFVTPKLFEFKILFLSIPKYQTLKTVELECETSKYIGSWLAMDNDEDIPTNTTVSYEYSYTSDGVTWTPYAPLTNDNQLRSIPVHGDKNGFDDRLKVKLVLTTTDEAITPEISEFRIKYNPVDITQELIYPSIIESYDSTIVFKIPKAVFEKGTMQFRVALSGSDDMFNPTYYDSWSDGTHYNSTIDWKYSNNYDLANDPNDNTLTSWNILGVELPNSNGTIGVNGAPTTNGTDTYYLRIILPSSWNGVFYSKLFAWNGLDDTYLSNNFKIYDEFIQEENYLDSGDGPKDNGWHLINSSKLTTLDSNLSNKQVLTAVIETENDNLSPTNSPFFYKGYSGDFDFYIRSNNKNDYPEDYDIGLKISDGVNLGNFIYVVSPNNNSQAYSYVNDSLTNNNSIIGYFNFLRLRRVNNLFVCYGKESLEDSWIEILQVSRTDIGEKIFVGLVFICENNSTRNFQIDFLKEIFL